MKLSGRISLLVFPIFIDVIRTDLVFRRDYCLRTPCNVSGTKQRHILCEFKHKSKAEKCADIKGKMSPVDRMRILGAHNIFRDQVMSSAEGEPGWIGYNAQCLRQFRWSYVLEEAAQIYAEQCRGEEAYFCAPDFVEDYQVWMSIYETEDPPDNEKLLEKAFHFWKSTGAEAKISPHNFVFSYNLPYAPLAAMLYWETFELGCGRSKYTKDGKKMGTVVCLYGPGINDLVPEKPADLFKEGVWYEEEGCNPGLCQNRLLLGIAEVRPPRDPWPFLCAVPQDEFAWNDLHIPDSSGPDDLEFIAKKSNFTSSAHPHKRLSVFLALSPVFRILNWME